MAYALVRFEEKRTGTFHRQCVAGVTARICQASGTRMN
jgi:hypothetical protein